MDVSKREQGQRYPVTEPSALPASIQYLGDVATPVHIRDLSRFGVGISLQEPPRIGESIVVSIQLRGEICRFHAVVKWGLVTDSGSWSAGCQFAMPLGQEFLTDLSQERLLAADPSRVVTSLPVQWHCDGGQSGTGQIVNTSTSGLCLATTTELGPGRNLTLRLSGGGRVLVRTHWERPDHGCILHGCATRDAGSQAILQQAVGSATCPAPGAHRRVAPGVLAGAVVVLSWFLLYLAGGWPIRIH